jgi:hypothetical protein
VSPVIPVESIQIAVDKIRNDLI